MVNEVVLRAFGITGMKRHLPTHLIISACTAGNGEYCIAAISIVRPLDSNLARGENDGPETLPYSILTGNGTHTVAIINTNLRLVGCIEDGIMEGKNIAQRIWARNAMISISDRVGDRVFDHVNGGAGVGVSVNGKHTAVHDEHECYEDNCYKSESEGGNKRLLHPDISFEEK